MPKSIVLAFAFVLSMAFSFQSATAAEALKRLYTDGEIVSMLQNYGWRGVSIHEEGQIRIIVDGTTYVLYVYDDGDLQLYFGLTGYNVNMADMNEWNRTKRLSRAYIDSVDDPVLESDLLANAGYNADMLHEFVKVFKMSADQFRAYLLERDRG